jgi:hypothetical protein
LDIVFRSANHDTPLWVDPNRWAFRYNRAGEGPTQYFSLHPLGCLAEYLRAQGLRTEAELTQRFVRVWAVKIDLRHSGKLDLTNAQAFGLRPYDLVSDDHGPCQDWASGVRTDPSTPKTWLVPSAALPGTENVIVFGPRVMSPFSIAPQDPALDTPATTIGDFSSLPTFLLSHVRFKGQRHLGYEASLRGQHYLFRDPPHYPVQTWRGPSDRAARGPRIT